MKEIEYGEVFKLNGEDYTIECEGNTNYKRVVKVPPKTYSVGDRFVLRTGKVYLLCIAQWETDEIYVSLVNIETGMRKNGNKRVGCMDGITQCEMDRFIKPSDIVEHIPCKR